jgi:hypothetical protein
LRNSGSRWLRREPHIHAPGTMLNDQFKGTDGFDQYLGKIETATSAIRALARAASRDLMVASAGNSAPVRARIG